MDPDNDKTPGGTGGFTVVGLAGLESAVERAARQDAIPTYASAYLVNMGSLHAEAPFHHLYRRGTAGVFVSVGTIRPEPVVDDDGEIVARRRVNVVYTVDERVTDGFYLVRSSHILQQMLNEPGALNKTLPQPGSAV